jgi:hypothetical protein
MNICIAISEEWFNLLRDSYSILHGCISVLHTYRQNKDQNYFKGNAQKPQLIIRAVYNFFGSSRCRMGGTYFLPTHKFTNAQFIIMLISIIWNSSSHPLYSIGSCAWQGLIFEWEHKFHQYPKIYIFSASQYQSHLKRTKLRSNGSAACISVWVTS